MRRKLTLFGSGFLALFMLVPTILAGNVRGIIGNGIWVVVFGFIFFYLLRKK